MYAIRSYYGSLERTVELMTKIPDLYVFSGDDAIDYPMLASGAKGITSVTSNLS